MAVEERRWNAVNSIWRRDLPDRTAAQITASRASTTAGGAARWTRDHALRSLFFDVCRPLAKYRTGARGGVSSSAALLTGFGKLRAARRPICGTRLAVAWRGLSMLCGYAVQTVHSNRSDRADGDTCRNGAGEMRRALESESHVNERMHFVTRLERENA